MSEYSLAETVFVFACMWISGAFAGWGSHKWKTRL